MTLAEAIAEGARALRDGGVADDRRTAAVLLGHVTGLDRAALIARSDQAVPESLLPAYLELIHRRAAGEPLQYLTGHQEFYGLDFKVTPDVLIPRPETEFLVEQVLTLAGGQAVEGKGRPVIVDAGTGSGCIAIALAVNLPNARVIGVDVSVPALEIARQNAAAHRVTDRIEFFAGDWLQPLQRLGVERGVDFLVSNPPYVPARNPHLLQREVRDWEPHVALFGGDEGLRVYQLLLDDGARYVRPGGYFICEIGYSQLEEIKSLIDPASWRLVNVTADLQGIPRTLTLQLLTS